MLLQFINEFNQAIKKANVNVFSTKYSVKFLPFVNLLYTEGFIQNYFVSSNKIFIYFRFFNEKNVLKNIKILSRSNRHYYLRYKNLWKISRFINGIFIFSTKKGLQTHFSCLKKKIGGKLLFFLN